MKKILFGLFSFGMLISVFFFPKFLGAILNCGMWLFSLKLVTPSIGIIGNFLIGTIVTMVTFWIVGRIFNRSSLHNRKIMSLAYLVIYTVVTFGLSTLAHNLLNF